MAVRVRYVVGCWLAVVLCAQCTVILGAPASGHGYETKSFAQAYLECLQYLNISRQSLYAYDSAAAPVNCGSNCLLRCIGLNTRWWHDVTGLNEKALVRFFRQVELDTLQQARDCVVELPTEGDTCAAAYRSFRCYSDALGELIAHPEYVVPGRQEIGRAVADCAAMLQVSDEVLESCVASGTFLHDGNATAVLRCVVLRLGLYADSTGVMCDRVQLLMDAETAEHWTVARAGEAKKCEQDLRELGADTCVAAAHAVEICYGWLAFGELWQVLKEEYGHEEDVFVGESETFETATMESVSSTTAKQSERLVYALPTSGEEEGEFKYPSSPRFRGLVIVAPELYAIDALVEDESKSSENSSTQDEDRSLSQDENVEVLDASRKQSTNEDNAVTKVANSESQESMEKVTDATSTVQKRCVRHYLYNPHESSAPLYYSSRIRRSFPVPHYPPHPVPMMHAHYPMANPIAKRSVPVGPMFAPTYNHVRFVRDVDLLDVDGVSIETPVPAAESPSPVETYAEEAETQHEELVSLFDVDLAAKNAEQDVGASTTNLEQEDVQLSAEDESVSKLENVQVLESSDSNSLKDDNVLPTEQTDVSEQSTPSNASGTLVAEDVKSSDTPVANSDQQNTSTSQSEDSAVSTPSETRSRQASEDVKSSSLQQRSISQDSEKLTPLETSSTPEPEEPKYSDDTSKDALAELKTSTAQPEVSEKSTPSEASRTPTPEDAISPDTSKDDLDEKSNPSEFVSEKSTSSEGSSTSTLEAPLSSEASKDDLDEKSNSSDGTSEKSTPSGGSSTPAPEAALSSDTSKDDLDEKLTPSEVANTPELQIPKQSEPPKEDLEQPKAGNTQPNADEMSTTSQTSSTPATKATSTTENTLSSNKQAIHPKPVPRLVRALQETNFIDTILSAIKAHRNKQ